MPLGFSYKRKIKKNPNLILYPHLTQPTHARSLSRDLSLSLSSPSFSPPPPAIPSPDHHQTPVNTSPRPPLPPPVVSRRTRQQFAGSHQNSRPLTLSPPSPAIPPANPLENPGEPLTSASSSSPRRQLPNPPPIAGNRPNSTLSPPPSATPPAKPHQIPATPPPRPPLPFPAVSRRTRRRIAGKHPKPLAPPFSPPSPAVPLAKLH